jgi:MFS family permease
VNRAVHAYSGLVAVLGNRNLRRLELAWGASITAEWAHFVALGVFAYDAGGTLGVGVAGLARMLAAALVAPFAASLGDRFRRERFLVVVALIGSAALAGSAIAASVSERVLPVYLLAAVVGLAATLVRPAQQALLPSLARTPAELIASNGATSIVESLGTLCGPLLAGVLVSVTSVGVVFAVGSGTFLAAALILARIRIEGRIQFGKSAAEPPGRMFLGGFDLVVRTPKPRLIAGLIGAQAFVRGCLNVLIVVTAFQVLKSGAGAVGYMTALLGVGGLIGALAAFTLEGRRLAAVFGLALVFWGAPIALIAPLRYLVAALVLLAIVGAANSVEDVAGFTLLQRIVPDDMLARVLGVLWGLVMGAVALGSIVAPAVVAVVGARAALVVVGAILPLLALASWHRLGEIDRTEAAPAAGLDLIDRVPMFEPLSIAAKERMAATLVPMSVAAGDVVFRAGDQVDRFYIVADGRLEVLTDGRHVPVHPGDHFGEIALLRDVPRTGTVRAVTDSRLYALEGDDFLAAVTGHAGVRAAGEAIVEDRFPTAG